MPQPKPSGLFSHWNHLNLSIESLCLLHGGSSCSSLTTRFHPHLLAQLPMTFTQCELLTHADSMVTSLIFGLLHVNLHVGVSIVMGVSKNGWYIGENPIRIDDLGLAVFQETSMCIEKVTCGVALDPAQIVCQLPVWYPKDGWSSLPFAGSSNMVRWKIIHSVVMFNPCLIARGESTRIVVAQSITPPRMYKNVYFIYTYYIYIHFYIGHLNLLPDWSYLLVTRIPWWSGQSTWGLHWQKTRR